jgi:hypothetical protein
MNADELRQAAAVMLAAAEGKPIECSDKGSEAWSLIPTPAWHWYCRNYRVAATKPSIDWNHVHPDYVAMATDDAGDTYLYKKHPEADTRTWYAAHSEPVPAEAFASFVLGTCDWKDSLVLRPTKEEAE